jgi:hypothetical protein
MARFDFHGDVAHVQLNQLNEQYQFPDFVKQAQETDITSLPERKGAYAETVNRHFPCHTKAATWLSCLYFVENGHNLPRELRERTFDHLQKFASSWGISSELEALQRRHAELAVPGEDRLPDSAFAIVKASSDGRLVRQYPLRNAVEVKAAAAWFHNNLKELREVYNFRDRQTIATRIMDKVAEYGADVGEFKETLEKSAGYGTSTAAQIAELFKKRAWLAVGKLPVEKIAAMETCANELRKRPAFFNDAELRADLVSALEVFDRQMGLTSKYAESVPAPEDVIFGLTRTKLSNLHDNAVELSNGSVFSLGQLQKLALEDLNNVFGRELAETVRRGTKVNVTKLANAAQVMSYSDAQTLEDLLLSAGETPIKAAAWSMGLSDEISQAIARKSSAGATATL